MVLYKKKNLEVTTRTCFSDLPMKRIRGSEVTVVFARRPCSAARAVTRVGDSAAQHGSSSDAGYVRACVTRRRSTAAAMRLGEMAMKAGTVTRAGLRLDGSIEILYEETRRVTGPCSRTFKARGQFLRDPIQIYIGIKKFGAPNIHGPCATLRPAHLAPQWARPCNPAMPKPSICHLPIV